MVIDTSALAAVLFREPERYEYLKKMSSASVRLVSAATLLELAIVVTRQGPAGSEEEMEQILERAALTIVGVDESQAMLAIGAFRRFGKGRHKAGLNFGDCF